MRQKRTRDLLCAQHFTLDIPPVPLHFLIHPAQTHHTHTTYTHHTNPIFIANTAFCLQICGQLITTTSNNIGHNTRLGGGLQLKNILTTTLRVYGR